MPASWTFAAAPVIWRSRYSGRQGSHRRRLSVRIFLTPCCDGPRSSQQIARRRQSGLKPTLSISRSRIHISTWLPRHSVSAILRITMRACEKSREFFAPGENAEFSILASPRGSWELCTGFISSRFCLGGYRDLRCSRALRVSSCVGRTLPVTRGNARTHETVGLRRSQLDAVYVRNRRIVPRQKSGLGWLGLRYPASRRSLLKLSIS